MFFCDAIYLVIFDCMYSFKLCRWSFRDVCRLQLEDGGRYVKILRKKDGYVVNVYDIVFIGEWNVGL